MKSIYSLMLCALLPMSHLCYALDTIESDNIQEKVPLVSEDFASQSSISEVDVGEFSKAPIAVEVVPTGSAVQEHSVADSIIVSEKGSENVSCPTTDFTDFLRFFIKIGDQQIIYTAPVLHVTTLDIAAEPEPKPVSEIVDRSQEKYPVIKSIEELNQLYGFGHYSSIGQQGKQAKYQINKEDTGICYRYYFELDKCWQLVEINDCST